MYILRGSSSRNMTAPHSPDLLLTWRTPRRHRWWRRRPGRRGRRGCIWRHPQRACTPRAWCRARSRRRSSCTGEGRERCMGQRERVGGIGASPVLYDPDAGIPNSHCNAHMHTQPQGSPIENAVCCRRHRLLQGAGGAGAGTWRPRGSRQASIHSGSLRRANLGTVYAVTDMDAPGRALWTATAWFGDSFLGGPLGSGPCMAPAGTLSAACRRVNWGRPLTHRHPGLACRGAGGRYQAHREEGCKLQLHGGSRCVWCVRGGMGGGGGYYVCKRCCLNAPTSAGMASMRWDPAA